jgi:hypothetical protein
MIHLRTVMHVIEYQNQLNQPHMYYSYVVELRLYPGTNMSRNLLLKQSSPYGLAFKAARGARAVGKVGHSLASRGQRSLFLSSIRIIPAPVVRQKMAGSTHWAYLPVAQ